MSCSLKITHFVFTHILKIWHLQPLAQTVGDLNSSQGEFIQQQREVRGPGGGGSLSMTARRVHGSAWF